MNLLQDIRYALRNIPRHRGFTALAVVTLALGIGAATTLFSVLHAVVLNPLGFEDPQELVHVRELRTDGRTSTLSSLDYLDLRQDNNVLDDLGAYKNTVLTLTGEGDAAVLGAVRASASLLSLLRIEPLLGRVYTDVEDQAGTEPVALLTHGTWRSRFGEDPAILGRRILLEGRSTTVLGVLPPGFDFPHTDVEVWIPLALSENELDRGFHHLNLVGRMHRGRTVPEVDAALSAIADRLAAQYAKTNTGHGIEVRSLHESVVGEVGPALRTLLGASLLVLLIACANVANLLLVRTAGRRRELVVRTAMGASRPRLARQLLTESLILGLLGGGAGLLLSAWGIQLAVAISPRQLPRAAEIGLDLPVVGFSLLLALATSLGFGLAPAIAGLRSDLQGVLRGSGSNSTERRAGRDLLIVAELALALMLLLGAGLLIRSFSGLLAVDPGFEPQGLASARVWMPASSYADEATQVAFVRQLLERVEALPGVESAVSVAPLPFSGNYWTLGVEVEGYEPSPEERRNAVWRTVSPGFFETFGIPLRAGRTFTSHDTGESTPVIVVNESMARHYWPNQNPLGQRVTIGYNDLTCEVVGVVGDIRHQGLDVLPENGFYTPFALAPWGLTDVVVRSQGKPDALFEALRSAVREIDAAVPVVAVRELSRLVAGSVAQNRFNLTLLALFAALALVLAGIGIYGVTSFAVAQRERELGIHASLGARPRDILWSVLRGGLRPMLAGTVLGLLGAMALSRLVTGMLYGVAPHDPATMVAGVVTLALLALLAMLAPARRAARVDPVTVLRQE